jgi:hypothetical protein
MASTESIPVEAYVFFKHDGEAVHYRHQVCDEPFAATNE